MSATAGSAMRVVAALLVALATTVARVEAAPGATPRGAIVASPEELAHALVDGVEHIRIARHLDLTGMPLQALQTFSDVRSAVFLIEEAVTIQVRSKRACLPTATPRFATG